MCPRHPDYIPIEKHKHTHKHHLGPCIDHKSCYYNHKHEYPCCDMHPLAAKAHYHGEVYHSHPHPEKP